MVIRLQYYSNSGFVLMKGRTFGWRMIVGDPDTPPPDLANSYANQ
jgi:hypothetical protein